MEGWTPAEYGERIAPVYDDLYEELFDKQGAVDFLSERARGGRALELAIGTGRIALPLQERGVEVHGIDISQAMVDRLRSKPGGSDIPVTIGDFADVAVEGTFSLVYLVFNTLFALPSQDEQLRCFRNVADRLASDGSFVVEAFVPDMSRYVRHQNVEALEVGSDRVGFDVSRHNPVDQTVSSALVFIEGGGVKTYPIYIRYIWPSEMDLMARLAGLVLRERYSSWRGDPFTAESQRHVSVFGKA